MLRKINNKSDFDFVLNLTDADENSVGWVNANWELTLYTTSRNFAYTATNAYGEKLNCIEQDGQIVIVVDRHEFPVGELFMDFAIDIPDKKFPDGSRHVSVTGEKTDIEMVLDRGAGGYRHSCRPPRASPQKGRDRTGRRRERTDRGINLSNHKLRARIQSAPLFYTYNNLFIKVLWYNVKTSINKHAYFYSKRRNPKTAPP